MRIIGTGSAVPDLVVTNKDLEAILDTSDEWIRTRTGICERRIHDGRLENLAAQACAMAIENAGLAASDIDLILCSNVYSKYMTPAMSCVVQRMIGATCPCLDINGACAGFVYALELADAHLRGARYKNILILCAEEPTRMADWTDRSTCVLFGDAAGAVVVTDGGGDFVFRMATVSAEETLYAYNTAGNCPYGKPGREYTPMYMNGQEVYKFVVNSAVDDVAVICRQFGISVDDVDHFVLHQANLRIIEAIRMRLKQPAEKFPCNMHRFGNTSSASIPLMLDEMNRGDSLRSGETIVFSAFGAGLTTGSCIFRL